MGCLQTGTKCGVEGTAAGKALAEVESGVMIGLRGRQMNPIPLVEMIGKLRPLDPDIYKMVEVLAGLPEEVSYRWSPQPRSESVERPPTPEGTP